MGLRILFFIVTIVSAVQAQHTVTLTVQLPKHYTSKNFYLAGNMNNWQPNDSAFQLQVQNERQATIGFTTTEKQLQYKITNGSWAGVECTTNGVDIANRVLAILSDTLITIRVAAFKNAVEDAFMLPSAVQKSTALAQVQKLTDSFYIPQLKRYRRIDVYLPKNYTGTTRFPVLYMLDGQNVFDAARAYSGEWNVDETLAAQQKQCIVVAIDNGGATRLQEYNPYINTNISYGNGDGKKMAAFIANTLKPFIDKKYKTKKDKANTAIAGSSMGGLIAYYTALKYNKIFGKAGVFSPSYWICAAALAKEIANTKKLRNSSFYIYAGTAESTNLVSEVTDLYNRTNRQCSNCKLQLSIKADKQHNEAAWGSEFPLFYGWLMY